MCKTAFDDSMALLDEIEEAMDALDERIKIDQLEKSLRQVGWKPIEECLAEDPRALANQAAAECAAYLNSLPVLRV